MMGGRGGSSGGGGGGGAALGSASGAAEVAKWTADSFKASDRQAAFVDKLLSEKHEYFTEQIKDHIMESSSSLFMLESRRPWARHHEYVKAAMQRTEGNPSARERAAKEYAHLLIAERQTIYRKLSGIDTHQLSSAGASKAIDFLKAGELK